MLRKRCFECKKKCMYLLECSKCNQGFCVHHRNEFSHNCFTTTQPCDKDENDEKRKKAIDDMGCIATKVDKI